ncbi:Ff.00g117500.m01.CDS01 [Fusarium sp. VM40]|nr:Ff.00g117500.m01.CDS01 [Fusarium sp. VM40]
MTLCELCKALPLDKLPSIPPHIRDGYLTGCPHIQQFYSWGQEDKGFPYHQSLEALERAATDLKCGLCNLVLGQVLQVQAEIEQANKLKESYSFAWPVWEFWLVKRPAGGHGFWVMSFTNEVMRGEAMLVAAIGLCVRDDDPLQAVIRGRPVEQQRGTPTAIRRVRNWLDECDQHPECLPTEPILPSRVIDVGAEVGSPYVSLRETLDRTVEHYCWGKTPQFTTTKSTLQDRKRCIAVSHLPKTHQDAIWLTQELGIRYIWIDSICIIQDDKEDWEHESANMLSVYANASLTIAASNGDDSHKGLFTEIPSRKYAQIDYAFGGIQGQALAFSCPLKGETFCIETDREEKSSRFPIFLDYITLPKEPLSGRGWTLQERVLSRRTLHYSDQQMFFECNKAYHGEDGLFLNARFDTIHQKTMASDINTKGIPSEGQVSISKDLILKLWYRLLWIYGERKLSKPSDKLPAISGLASIFAKRLDDQYVAGLWRSDLVVGLSWEGLHCKRVEKYRAPSWSWVSVDGIIGCTAEFPYTPLATIIDVKVDLKGANPYGEILDGRIRICASMRRLYLADDDSKSGSDKLGRRVGLELRMDNINDEDVSGHFDYDEFAKDSSQGAAKMLESLRGKELFALLLLDHVEFKEQQLPLKGLIIAKVQGTEEYQRFGTIRLPRWALKDRFEGGQEEMTTVTLV